AEGGGRLIGAVGVAQRNARRCGHVIGRAEEPVGSGVRGGDAAAERAGIGAAGCGEMAGATRYRARGGQLLVPEQRLAEIHLGLRDGIAGGHRRITQRRRRLLAASASTSTSTSTTTTTGSSTA